MQKPPSVRSDHTQLSVKYKYVKFTLCSAMAPKCSVETFITNIDLTDGNERELLDNYWMPSISAGGKSAS